MPTSMDHDRRAIYTGYPLRDGQDSPRSLGKLAERRGRVVGAEDRRSRDEPRRAGLGAVDDRLGVDAAVDLHRHVVADHRAHAADLLELAGDERLAAPAGVDGHDQREVEVDLGEVVGWRPRTDDETGAAAGVADRVERV